MKFTVASVLALGATTASAHTIFFQAAVNGVSKAAYSGVRAQTSNNPYKDVTIAEFACGNSPIATSDVISVAAGDTFSTFWQHQPLNEYAGDSDNPIASSHKGPIQVYLAKVDDAATAAGASAKWTKIASQGLDLTTGKWAVDDFIANAGWWNVTIPSCIAPGDYLLRPEIIGLHEASSSGLAQFYFSCAQIRVTSGGSTSIAGTGVSFPGAYSATDPGILINIYGDTGLPNNNLKAYVAPGPTVLTCGAGSVATTTAKATTLVTSVRTTSSTSTTKAATTSTTSVKTTSTSAKATSTTSTKAAATTAASTTGASLYGQCGGTGWTGATSCAVGTCTYSNPYYSQCLN